MPKYIDVSKIRLTAVGTVDEGGDILHSKLEHLRINGEWYEISSEGVERVKKYIERI